MARVRAGAAHTNAAGGGGGATVLVVERAALGVALLSFGEEVAEEEVAEVAEEVEEEKEEVAEVAEVVAEEVEEAAEVLAEAALVSATEINAICIVCDKVAPLNTTPPPRALPRWSAYLDPDHNHNPDQGSAALLVLLPAGVRVDLKWLALVRSKGKVGRGYGWALTLTLSLPWP